MITARWDWYQATIRESGHDVQAALLAWFTDSWLEPTTVRIGYGEAYALRDSEGRHAIVQQGGRNAWPNVTFSGEDAPIGAEFLREHFPLHEVTRIDSAIDLDDGEGTWERLSEQALQVADDRGARVLMFGDFRPGRGEEGRTIYVGAPTSAVRVRYYEKGKELRAKHVPLAAVVPLTAVRCEVQVRPSGMARSYASRLSPLAAWGFAKFSGQLLELITGSGVDSIHVRDLRASNDDRAIAFLAKQYGPMLRRQAERRGSLDAVWAHLELLLAETEREARA